MCTLDQNQPASKFGPPKLTGFTMRTTTSSGSQVQSLPISSTGNIASFFGPLPAGTSREFTCQVSSGLVAATGAMTGTMAVMSRGVEDGKTEEPEIVQPSPFDPSEGMATEQHEKAGETK
jgi:hypothetical protein